MINSVHEESGNHKRNKHEENSQKDSKDQETPQQNEQVFHVSEEKVGQAIESFQSDSQAKANGLNANVVGYGPGLKVLLKDNQGAIVRELTGEEFVKLRETTSRDGRTRGKILDKKL
ncbi:MAG: hypothetical protein AABZ06_04210 [Bdellovibrionota bacterium]